MKIGKDWVDRSTDGSTVAAGDDHLGHDGHDAHGGLLPYGLECLVDWGDAVVLDDLSLLHALTRSDVQVGHVALDIGIADDREHLGEAESETSGKQGILISNLSANLQLNNLKYIHRDVNQYNYKPLTIKLRF